MSNRKYGIKQAKNQATSLSKQFQPKPLARAIALALMAGMVALPVSGWAATISGIKFVDDNRTGGERETEEPPFTGGGAIYLKSTTAPATQRPTVVWTSFTTGSYTLTNVAPGTYKVWQYVNPTTPIYTLMSSPPPEYFASEATAKIITVANATDAITQDFPVPNLTRDATMYMSDAQAVANTICTSTSTNVVTVSGNPATWPASLNENSILVISSGAVVDVPDSIPPIHVQAVCNSGTLRDNNQNGLIMTYDALFANFGTGRIEGQNATPTTLKDGSSIDLKAFYDPTEVNGVPIGYKECPASYGTAYGSCEYYGLFYNEGVIQAGNGLDRSYDSAVMSYTPDLPGGKGGSVSIDGQRVVQNGTIQGGNGGDVKFNNAGSPNDGPSTGGKILGGEGGAITIWSGGTLTGSATSVTMTGEGGDVTVVNACLGCVVPIYGGDSGSLTLDGGTLLPKGLYKGSSIYVDPTVSFMGSDTTLIADEDVVIFGGDKWLLELRNLNPEAIMAGRKIILATGPGGTIDLRGNTAKIFKAGVQVEIYTDNLLLDAGVLIDDLVDAPNAVVRSNAKIIYHAVITGTGQLTGNAGDTLPVNLTLRNAGPKQDTYILSATNQNGSGLVDLPAIVTLEGLTQTELNFNVILPMEGDDIITVTATSQADPTVVATITVSVTSVAEEVQEEENDNSVPAITITKTGDGNGVVQSRPAGIRCGKTCEKEFPENTTVKLVAFAHKGSLFAGWEGDCSGTAKKTTVTVDQHLTCEAKFEVSKPAPEGMFNMTVKVEGEGDGVVTANGINCAGDCQQNHKRGKILLLKATPDESSTFVGWSGDCEGVKSPLQVKLEKDLNCIATFQSK